MHSEPCSGDPADTVTHSVVVPVYRNEQSLAQVMVRLGEVADRVPGRLEAVFVVDGSPDGSLDLLRQLAPTAGLPVQVASLSRNFGSFSAIRAGLELARGQYVAVMAADLQEPPELLEDFFAALGTGEHDVAVGVRTGRNDPALTSLMSRAFWAVYRRLILPDIPRGGVDIFACTAQVRDSLVSMRESHTSLVGLIFWLGFRRVEVPYVRAARETGRSGWTFRRRLRYLFDSVFAFTDLPITVLIFLGCLGSFMSVAAAIAVFVAWATGNVEVAGYTPLMLSLLIISSLLLLALGIVGSYVWRAYENTKRRPVSVIRSVEGHDGRTSTRT